MQKKVNISLELGKENKLIQSYIKNRLKEHCEVIGPHCAQCAVNGYCEHKKNTVNLRRRRSRNLKKD